VAVAEPVVAPAPAVPPARPLPWEDEPAAPVGAVQEDPIEDAPPALAESFTPLVEPPVEPPAPAPAPGHDAPVAAAPEAGSDDWHGIINQMNLGGMVRELAQNCELLGISDAQVRLRLAPQHKHLMATPSSVGKLQDGLGQYFGRPMRAAIEIGAVGSETPAQRNDAERKQRHSEAVQSLAADPFVQEMIERFDATLLEASVKPI
ncbi:MAG: DNA polymerase III subunit gamma/tau C-terminal domain-containing protein, partial [Rhodocyclaceae bacterium]